MRDATLADLEDVLRLNQAHGPAVSPLTAQALRWLHDHACFHKVEVAPNGRVEAFLLGLDAGLPYDSPNYAWFSARYEAFLYVDRVVVGPPLRSSGTGTRLYSAFYDLAKQRRVPVTCEVNVRPRNDVSLAFHRRQGFEEVGTQETEGGNKEVVMLVRPSA